MRKQKIYLDTSIVSYLDQLEQAEKHIETAKLWSYFRQGHCDVCISSIVLEELARCEQELQKKLHGFLGQFEMTVLSAAEDEVMELVDRYVDEKVLTRKHDGDLLHLATATVNHCQILLSWNFRHIVQNRTMLSVNLVNRKYGYGELLLISPFSFHKESTDDTDT